MEHFKLINNKVFYWGPAPSTAQDAYQISLNKWRFIIEKLKETRGIFWPGGIYTCGFCMLYRLSSHECYGCPIYKRTGQIYCNGTPHDDFMYALGLASSTDPERFSKAIDRAIYFAEQELKFLESLEIE